MRFTLAIGLLGSVVATLALRLTGQAVGIWWLLVCVEFYLAICLMSLAAVYGLRSGGVRVEELLLRPVWWPIVRVILLPYSLLGGITLYIARWFSREGLLNRVAPGLYIGRLPFPYELVKLRAAGIEAVLNLCWEFPRFSGTDREPGFETAHVPILDGFASVKSAVSGGNRVGRAMACRRKMCPRPLRSRAWADRDRHRRNAASVRPGVGSRGGPCDGQSGSPACQALFPAEESTDRVRERLFTLASTG